MCGVFGISYGPQGPAGEAWTPTEFATLMFPAVVHRGPHAFGWFYHVPNGPVEFDKYPGKVTEHRNLDKVYIPENVEWFACHVRFATKGDPKVNSNNHPLISGNVIGIHNGTLSGGWQAILDEVGREEADATVDSEAIFAAVSKWGVEAGLRRIDGNMVAVLAETAHPGVLNIARSYGRPLVYATTKAGSLIFASECCVIEACGIEDDLVIIGKDNQDNATPYQDVKGQYRLFTVVQGKIVARKQYRTPPPKRPVRPVPTSVPFEQGGVSGITDYFARQRDLKRPVLEAQQRTAAGRQSSLDDPAKRDGTARGNRDRWGGTYIGAGWYRLSNGNVMSVQDYVEYRVQQEHLRTVHEAEALDLDAVLDAEADLMAAEDKAQSIIDNNMGG